MHHWANGTNVSVEDIGDGIILRPIKTTQSTRRDDLIGSLQAKDAPRTIQEIDPTIDNELRDHYDSGRY